MGGSVVILSAAKNLEYIGTRFFAALRMTSVFLCLAPLPAHASLPGFLTAKHFGETETLPTASSTLTDRHGDALITDPVLITQLVSEGKAVCYLAQEVLTPQACHAAEKPARAKKLGVWKHIPQLRSNELEAGLDYYRGRFVEVTGTVQDVAEMKRQTYINFGADRTRDTTLLIATKNRTAFDQTLAALKGKRLRARGWVESYNGPMIKLTSPMQWEVE
jgi:hypothetical protein